MKKNIIFYSIILILCNSKILTNQAQNEFAINYHNYTIQADKWLKTYILDNNNNLLISKYELQLIANLAYFSFMRSYYTLKSQSQAIKTLENVWQGWQNISQTRLDPSIGTQNKITEPQKQDSIVNFWKVHDKQQEICATYSKCIQSIIDGDILTTSLSKDCIKNMRNQAITVVAQSILNIKNYIGELFYSKNILINKNKNLKTKANTTENTLNKVLSKKISQKISKNILQKIPFLNHIMSYLPKISLHSFIKASKANDLFNKESWKVLKKVQTVSIRTWEIIELERAAFYLAFYKSLWKTINYLNLNNKLTLILFDKNGLLENINQDFYIQNKDNYLPDPKNLIQNKNL